MALDLLGERFEEVLIYLELSFQILDVLLIEEDSLLVIDHEILRVE